MPVVLDVETVPTEAALALPYPEADRQHPGNYKDPEAIARWREHDRQRWQVERVKECSLSPRLGRVLCLGYSDGPTVAAVVARTEEEERGLLDTFWQLMEASEGRVAGFNSRTFDLPFIVLRSLHHGITPTIASETVRSWFAKYRVRPHTDARDLLTQWNQYGDGTLGEWCAFLGVPYDAAGLTGSDVYELHRAGRWTEIAAKCQADVMATRGLLERMAGTFTVAAA